jgi:hypothetical protein
MQRSILGVLVGAGAITVCALLTVVAPAAQAEPISETTIKSECKEAGGNYSTTVAGGLRGSSCTYKANDGTTHTDNYNNGTYSGTNKVPKPKRPA